jgi:hypothetical protein
MQHIEQLKTRPTFADLLDAIEIDKTFSAPRKTELRRDIEAFCGWLDRSPSTLPADPRLLRPHVAALQIAVLGISAKRMANVKSSVNAALASSAIERPCAKPIGNLSAPWADLHENIRGSWAAAVLSPLFRYADAIGLAPEQIDDEVVASHADYRQETSLARNPQKAISKIRGAWNKAAREIAGWPAVTLSIGRKRDDYLFPWTKFPKEFVDDVDAYAAACGRQPSSAADYAAGSRSRRYRGGGAARSRDRKPLAKSTIDRRRDTLRLAASTLVHEGQKRFDEIVSVASVISVSSLEIVADCILDRNETSTGYGWTVGKHFRSIATQWLSPSREEIEEYNKLVRELKADGVVDGMNPKNRERLRQFDDPAVFAKLVCLPEHVFAELEKRRGSAGAVTPAMALEAEAAIGVLILLSVPVRRSTLARTHLVNNIRWPQGRRGTATLHYSAQEETKTGRSSSAILAEWKAHMLKLYRRHYQPLLTQDRDNAFLFPALAGPAHKSVGALAETITKMILRRTGLRMNLHLFRHLVGTKILADDPTNTALVQSILGHAPGSKQTIVYAEIAAQQAAAHLERVIEREVTSHRDHRPIRARASRLR